jgi:cellulose 1,4-beta-cellobiosidase
MYGTCCTEMDLWESNAFAQALTPHVCTTQGLHRCSGEECGDDDKGQREDGVCDKDGCDLNPFRMGNHTFYGQGGGFAIDTTQPFTVVTQFVTSDGSDAGTLSAIRRFYRQNGKVIPTPTVTVGGSKYDSITDTFCAAQKKEFGDVDGFEKRGGLRALGADLDQGMVRPLHHHLTHS